MAHTSLFDSFVAILTYNCFSNGLQESMANFIGEATDLCQSAQCHFLSLRGLLQLRRVLLEYTKLLLKDARWVELGHTNLANRAVTDKCAETENVSNHCLIVRLPEHK